MFIVSWHYPLLLLARQRRRSCRLLANSASNSWGGMSNIAPVGVITIVTAQGYLNGEQSNVRVSKELSRVVSSWREPVQTILPATKVPKVKYRLYSYSDGLFNVSGQRTRDLDLELLFLLKGGEEIKQARPRCPAVRTLWSADWCRVGWLTSLNYSFLGIAVSLSRNLPYLCSFSTNCSTFSLVFSLASPAASEDLSEKNRPLLGPAAASLRILSEVEESLSLDSPDIVDADQRSQGKGQVINKSCTAADQWSQGNGQVIRAAPRLTRGQRVKVKLSTARLTSGQRIKHGAESHGRLPAYQLLEASLQNCCDNKVTHQNTGLGSIAQHQDAQAPGTLSKYVSNISAHTSRATREPLNYAKSGSRSNINTQRSPKAKLIRHEDVERRTRRDSYSCVTGRDSYSCVTGRDSYSCVTGRDSYSCVTGRDSYSCVTGRDSYSCVTGRDSYSCVTLSDTALISHHWLDEVSYLEGESALLRHARRNTHCTVQPEGGPGEIGLTTDGGCGNS
ncbi:hypothetical protein RRG08_020978 [Elysia crispata]|uniref:Uncharacterized protein n=1 Tax=Elysia crispata TaxID=231223 RepID=A0AAE0ZMW3_9GAST|nr:hypothetical protein RRG08_020978 [Elysia crispata]